MVIYMPVSTLLSTFAFDTTHDFPELFLKTSWPNQRQNTRPSVFFSSDKITTEEYVRYVTREEPPQKIVQLLLIQERNNFNTQKLWLDVSFYHILSLYDKI